MEWGVRRAMAGRTDLGQFVQPLWKRDPIVGAREFCLQEGRIVGGICGQAGKTEAVS